MPKDINEKFNLLDRVRITTEDSLFSDILHEKGVITGVFQEKDALNPLFRVELDSGHVVEQLFRDDFEVLAD